MVEKTDSDVTGVPAAKGQAAAPGDPWQFLQRYTSARIALGRVGSSMPTAEVLRFGWAHAQAQDAVHKPLMTGELRERLHASGLESVTVRSRASERETYLLRPDLGRLLEDDARNALQKLAAPCPQSPGLVFVVADGLSALAVEQHACALILATLALLPADWRIGPVVLVTQGRVAIGDDIGQALGADAVAVLIGERPGLGSPDSLGVYVTHAPRRGRTDAERNCISNIRPAGLAIPLAARKLAWLLTRMREMKISGIALKEEAAETPLSNRIQG